MYKVTITNKLKHNVYNYLNAYNATGTLHGTYNNINAYNFKGVLYGNRTFISKSSLVKSVPSDSQDAFTITSFGVNAAGEENFKIKGSGHVFAREVTVTQNNFPDYVFASDYKLMPLPELKMYIQKEQHLPNIPSAKEMEEDPIGLGELVRLQMEKIEELTLHIIELNERIDGLEKKNK